jgi:DNA replication protein DnaC
MSLDVFSIGPEPTWLSCSGCGIQTSRSPCWDCTQASEARHDAARERTRSLGTIPARFAWASLKAPELAERCDARNYLALAKRVLAGHGAVFAGKSGSGKTSLAVACLRERMPRAMYVSALRLSTARIQSKAGDGEAGLVAEAIAAPLLLVDEVGGESKTSTSAVRDVVFERHDAGKPTWITTGFTSAELAAMYGDGFLRRVVDGATLIRLGPAEVKS